MKICCLALSALLLAVTLHAQLQFSNATYLLPADNINSGSPMAVADLNGDGLDDIARLDNASDLVIDYQQPDGSFVRYVHGDMGQKKEWGMCVADVDEDGYRDILCGGEHNRIKVARTGEDGVVQVYWLPLPNVFLQAINVADINNDGLADVFACHDVGLSAPFRNDGNNQWAHDLGLINAVSTIPSDNSGNYGSVWTDYDSDGDLDLYISKCRGGVTNPLDGRRTNLLFENNGANQFTEVAEARGLRPLAQSWSADFADIDNDGDLDAFVVNHDMPSILYENQGNTFFANINAAAGIEEAVNDWSTGIQVVMEDFTNDGFVDILLTGGGGLRYLVNDGDGTFTWADLFPDLASNMHSLAVGDLNNDGFLDVVAGFGNGYNSPSGKEDVLFLNNGNGNNWLKAALTGRQSNRDGIGARAELYGPWGVQVREVRAGESYGIQHSFDLHFGLGTATAADSLVIRWPSGARDVLCAPAINTRHRIAEGCLPFCGSGLYTAEALLCPGDSVAFAGDWLHDSGQYVHTFPAAGGCDSTVTLSVSVGAVRETEIVMRSCDASQAGVVPEYLSTWQGCDSTVLHITTYTPMDTGVTLAGMTLSAASGYTYTWVDCDNGFQPVAGATLRDFTPASGGNYAVIVSDGVCSDTSSCHTVEAPTAVVDPAMWGLAVYPNPVRDRLQVMWNRPVAGGSWVLRHVSGAEAARGQLSVVNRTEVDMRALPSGYYLLELRLDGAVVVHPVIRP